MVFRDWRRRIKPLSSQRVASADSACGQPQGAVGGVGAEACQRVDAARGHESAVPAQDRAEGELVRPDRRDEGGARNARGYT